MADQGNPQGGGGGGGGAGGGGGGGPQRQPTGREFAELWNGPLAVAFTTAAQAVLMYSVTDPWSDLLWLLVMGLATGALLFIVLYGQYRVVDGIEHGFLKGVDFKDVADSAKVASSVTLFLLIRDGILIKTDAAFRPAVNAVLVLSFMFIYLSGVEFSYRGAHPTHRRRARRANAEANAA